MTEHVGHEVSQLKLVSTAKIRQHIFRDSRFNSFCASTNFGGLNM